MKYFLLILSVCLLLIAYGCGSDIDRQLDEAEALVQFAPDSAEIILNRLVFNEELSHSQKARRSLLLSVAKTRQSKTFATCGDLNEAIDFYRLENDTVALFVTDFLFCTFLTILKSHSTIPWDSLLGAVQAAPAAGHTLPGGE